MSQRKRIPAETADTPLNRSLTEAFSQDLMAVLSTDQTEMANYLSSVIFSKFTEVSKEGALDRRTKAIEKWLATEELNSRTNLRFQQWGESEAVDVLPGVSAKRFLDKVAIIVAQVLPWAPSLDLTNGGFSGGSSTSKRRRHGHPAVKFRDKADVTRLALPLFRDVNRGTRWAAHMEEAGLEPRFVVGNVMFTVPKDSTIDRCACKEPDLNMFLQKCFGTQIRLLLKRSGIDLNDQTINQELARQGSVDGSLATLDLSSASDSVSTGLVRRVLPEAWFYYMDQVRSHITEIDGVTHRNEMFSSMGNGFTFELESLLFYAIARATAYFGGWKGRISVYGDDLIVPAGMFDDIASALSFCGFRLNPNKSFGDGPFRESCGAHWHSGVDIKPFYIRRPFARISDLILTLNQLTEWSSRHGGVVDPRYEEIINKYREFVPQQLWGGSDLTSRTSLVTGHAPRSKLVYPVEDKDHLHIGGLLLWLFQTTNRESEGCLFVSAQTPPAFARMRRRRERTHTDIGLDVPVFLGLYQEDTSNVAALAG